MIKNVCCLFSMLCLVGVLPSCRDIEKNVEEVNISAVQNNDSLISYGEIILPSVIHVAEGRECNLWWSTIANVPEGDKSVYFETVCEIGHNNERSFTIKVTDVKPEFVGKTYPLRIVCRRTADREILSDVTTSIMIVAANKGEGVRNICHMGDSRTWQSYGGKNGTDNFKNFQREGNKTITTELKYLLDSNKGFSVNLVGHEVSKADPSVKNLAQSGQRFTYPIEQFKAAGGCKAYMEKYGLPKGEKLDYVPIMYGINDLSDWEYNGVDQFERSVKKVPQILENAKKLIDETLAAYPKCKVILVLEPSTCGSQDGWGAWVYRLTWRHSMMEMEKAMLYLRKVLIQNFDEGKYHPNVSISSAGLWCDRLYGYPYIMVKESERTSAKIKEQFVECVHPFDDGYKQISDGIFSTIKALEE